MKCLRVVLLFHTFIVHTASLLLSFIGIAHPTSRNNILPNGYERHHHNHVHRVRRCRAVVESRLAAAKESSTTTDPNYWYNENDPFIIIDNNQIHTSGMLNNLTKDAAVTKPTTLREQLLQHNIDPTTANSKCIKFTIRGNPRVLIRHRTARGFVYNPSKSSQDNFRNVLLEILPRGYHPTIPDDDHEESDDEDYRKKNDTNTKEVPTVLFTQDDYLSLSLTFRMKRPRSHFINNKPGHNRLKKQFTSSSTLTTNQYSNIRSDIDNLCKFVMDTLNGILYVDDRQVVRLTATKVLDCEGECLGATEVEIRVL